MTCKGCGGTLPPNKGSGPKRIWCSQRCRKRQYAGVCVVCGAPTNGYNGRQAPEYCGTHNPGPERGRAVRAAQKDRRYKVIAKLYRDGLSYKEMGAAMGCPAKRIGVDIIRMRSEGWDLGYRLPPHRRKPWKAAP